jgi:hypothetical protein
MDIENAFDQFAFSDVGTIESSRKGFQEPPGPDKTQLTFVGGVVRLWNEFALSSSLVLIFF